MPNTQELSGDHQCKDHTEDKLASKLLGPFVVFVNSIPVTYSIVS
jgi:hypothetical protein